MTTLNMTLGEARDLIEEGVIFGHADFHCRAIRGLDLAEEQDLACVESAEDLEAAKTTRAGALLVPEALGGVDAHQLIVPDPRATLQRLLARLSRAEDGTSEPAAGSRT